MSNYNVYTKKAYGLDNKVWRVMLITIILSFGLLSYSLVSRKECVPVDFVIKALEDHGEHIYMTGEELVFKVTSQTTDITWDFGDNRPKAYGNDVVHKYNTEGDFFVTAGTGRGCEKFQKITIRKAVDKEKQSNIAPGTEIAGPTTSVVGRQETFFSLVTADSYEWSVSKMGGIKTEATFKLTFPVSGTYTVQVTLDHDRTKRYTKEIVVNDSVKQKLIDPVLPNLPEITGPGVAPLPEARPTMIISEPIFQVYLENVIAGLYTVNNFDDYLCNRGKTPATLNGKLMDFAAVCQKLNGLTKKQAVFFNKSVKIKSVSIQRNGGNDCVTMLVIKYK
ncbi:hypothetical protein BH11BAC4_BH11BAC4_22280 [soil metagenome]